MMVEPHAAEIAESISEGLDALGVLAMPGALDELRRDQSDQAIIDWLTQEIDVLLRFINQLARIEPSRQPSPQEAEPSLRALRDLLLAQGLQPVAALREHSRGFLAFWGITVPDSVERA
jgi:hypothetical protein